MGAVKSEGQPMAAHGFAEAPGVGRRRRTGAERRYKVSLRRGPPVDFVGHRRECAIGGGPVHGVHLCEVGTWADID